ncbi:MULTISPECIES: GntR family transcriptional regulator [Streptomyces]|uniref:DNA-binding GntR family transcriptional regulator n=1 Tax=Streptomyces demainii TaxID=588122 RepID=A0ABT9KPC2_9ACTN|nr:MULTISPECIES: GntR family transcriptional regulator [Streptomyces]MCO8304732.1 GntR family transcriptional regulator [Streptomyces sp. RKCA744]MDN3057446.1 GntR family transcriptional regulator [Streptomyces sp. SRF1]MDP9610289.1 DNA-binding GntR family transcriptional regulator [Streptomyces demainii]WAP55842.1 GntR family transcriptional regulator [Streptomyces sp. S465]
MANKADQAYDVLEQMITFQELPPGSLVSEARLMERTGLGRTPVREALQRLARERMVEIHPSQGVFVAATSIEAQLKVLELRRSMEELAVRLAAHRATTAQRDRILALGEVLSAFDGDDPREFGDLLKQTHTRIVEAAHNEYLSVAMAPLQGLSRRFWFAHLRNPKAELAEAARLHGDILRAICHGDEAKASEASVRLNDYLTDFTYRTLRTQ